MSPEQAEGLKVDYRSDIFSFGAVLYEMLTGHRAFDGDSGISTLSAVLRDEVKPIHEIAPEVPAELADLVNRCLRKNPEARWQSMTDVEAELTSLKRRSDSGNFHSPAVSSPAVSSPSVSSPAVSSMKPAVATRKSGVRKAILLGAVCVAVLALAILGAWWSTHQKETAATVAATAPAVSAPASSAPSSSAPVSNPGPVSNPDQPPAAPVQATPAQAETPPAQVQAPPTPHRTAATLAADSLPPSDKPSAAPKKSVSPYAPASAKPATVATAPPVPTPTEPAPAAPVFSPRPVAVAPVIPSAAPAELVPVKLTDGIPFRIALLEDVPIDAEVGRALRFRVLDGVQSGQTTVIAKGSIVTGALADLGGKRNFFGERSKVRFRLIAAESVDDAKISVRATPAPRSDGENRPFATPNGTKDKDLIAASGTEYIAYISGEQNVSVHK
jgi:serine/threonine-protein kinase